MSVLGLDTIFTFLFVLQLARNKTMPSNVTSCSTTKPEKTRIGFRTPKEKLRLAESSFGKICKQIALLNRHIETKAQIFPSKSERAEDFSL